MRCISNSLNIVFIFPVNKFLTNSSFFTFADNFYEFIPDSASIASSIKFHAEFTTPFSPEKFELNKAFFATAESVRDSLIINWNATNDYYERKNVKLAYYMSMEYLQVLYRVFFIGGRDHFHNK